MVYGQVYLKLCNPSFQSRNAIVEFNQHIVKLGDFTSVSIRRGTRPNPLAVVSDDIVGGHFKKPLRSGLSEAVIA